MRTAISISPIRAVFSVTILLLVLAGCTAVSGNISIEPMIVQGSVGAIGSDEEKISYKSDYYVVDNFANTKKVRDSLSYFAELNKDPFLAKYNSYSIAFYKTSWNTQLEDIRRNPGYADRYIDQDDLILIVEWRNGKFYTRRFYDEASLNKVVIEDL